MIYFNLTEKTKMKSKTKTNLQKMFESATTTVSLNETSWLIGLFVGFKKFKPNKTILTLTLTNYLKRAGNDKLKSWPHTFWKSTSDVYGRRWMAMASSML